MEIAAPKAGSVVQTFFLYAAASNQVDAQAQGNARAQVGMLKRSYTEYPRLAGHSRGGVSASRIEARSSDINGAGHGFGTLAAARVL
ncbi:MAG: hypothetical protein LBQ32_01275 [Burkholderiaceae bacterium]|nr:hypothetical protein [Burkholderiaceae bacterium]